MVMSDGDVVKYYHDLKDKKNATRLIAELNAVAEAEIIKILEKAGITPKSRKKANYIPRKEWKAFEEMYRQGMTDTEIAKKIGVSRGAVEYWRTKHGLPTVLQVKSDKKREEKEQRMMMKRQKEPVEIGFCAGCGDAIWSDEPYLVDDTGNMVHADGHFCFVDTLAGRKKIPCAALYFSEICLWDEAINAMGLERKEA